MSITDELRGYARGYETMVNHKLLAIADRIDAEHERICYDYQREHDEWVASRDANWVKLPVDADGEVWHVGDLAVGEVNPNNPQAVERMLWYGPDSGWQLETDHIIFPCPERVRHYHAPTPTIEDVTCEFLQDLSDWLGLALDIDCIKADSLFAEYAAKLRLAVDE